VNLQGLLQNQGKKVLKTVVFSEKFSPHCSLPSIITKFHENLEKPLTKKTWNDIIKAVQ